MKQSHVTAILWVIWRVTARALVAAGILMLILALPFPAQLPRWMDMVYVGGAVAGFIIYIGKLLIDTFFYDRYK